MAKYLLTQDQYEGLQHTMRMLEMDAGTIEQLCSSEKDDVVYGFSLGKVHTSLRRSFIAMLELEDEIRNQKVADEDR